MKTKEISEIAGYEPAKGYYICEDGSVFHKNKKLKCSTCSDGYKYLDFRNKGCRTKTVRVHRLVMLAFSGEPEQEQVNHIDGNKCNNHIDNLEWCTNYENRRHAIKLGLKDEVDYWIVQLDMNGKFVSVHRTCAEAHIALGHPISAHIGEVIRNKRKSAMGFKWMALKDFVNRL